MEKCYLCKKRFADGQTIVPLYKAIHGKYGDFTSSQPVKFAHIHCFIQQYNK